MQDVATPAVLPRELWQSIPLECLLCAAAIVLAACLKLAGVMP